jgi:hypothetical protein
MEKQGVIKPGTTPPEQPSDKLPTEKRAQIEELDNDFRKRAADAASK